MLKLPHDLEALSRQVAAQFGEDPYSWVRKILMKEIKKFVSEDAIRNAKTNGRKHNARLKQVSDAP